ncbi:MAG: hypothetical protein J5800_03565 [Spirochaetales bacterium]|nr:hypothetical protein [Spirochaetales bacterium]
MALINSQDRYIRLLPDGSYLIYASKADRDKEKAAPKADFIVAFYDSTIKSLLVDEERQYYDTEAWDDEYSSWCNERLNYLFDLQNYNTGNQYPLVESLVAGVSDSIPNIIESGNVIVGTETAAMMYALAKSKGYFGETEDA